MVSNLHEVDVDLCLKTTLRLTDHRMYINFESNIISAALCVEKGKQLVSKWWLYGAKLRQVSREKRDYTEVIAILGQSSRTD